jgi:hypothetical protein
MEQQFVATHTDTQFYRGKEKKVTDPQQPTFKQHVKFLRKYKEKHYICGHILRQGVSVSQLSTNTGISD